MGWFKKIQLRVSPLHQLKQHPGPDGSTEYQSEGEDPQFDLQPMEGFSKILPGWHVFTADMVLLEGGLVTPCFYPDYGEGLSEATRIDLPEPDARGRIKAVVLIKGRLRSLRFDPTIHPARFSIQSLSIRKLSRLGALLKMLHGIHRGAARELDEHGGAFGALRVFLRHAFRGEVTLGGDHVAQLYKEVTINNEYGYMHWAALFDARTAAKKEQERLRITALKQRPLISIVLPTHETALPFLRKCIESVCNQTYPYWQLCIADDASSPPVRHVLQEYADSDPRIVLHLRNQHGHIAKTSNDALGCVSGEYVGFLDHDDMLAPGALTEVAMAIVQNQHGRLFYSDEDKVDESGNRYDPHFKPAWNPELLLSQNYICHFLVVHTALVREVGGFRAGFEGAQDHDLILRCTEKLQRHQIVHIPKVLYHWRATAGSTALGHGEKNYAQEAGRLAVQQHLARTGEAAEVDSLPSGYYSARRKLPVDAPLATIVIPSRDQKQMLSACIDSILSKTEYPNYHIVVVDNGSVESDARSYLAELRGNPRVTVVDYAVPFNFSAIINRGVRHAQGGLLCVLNNDVEVITPGWLDEMAVHALRPEVGVVGCMLYYPDDTVQHAGVVLGIGGVAGHVHSRLIRGGGGYMGRAHIAQNLSAVTGACMVMRREVFDQAGGFDEGMPVAFNDIDFCLRLLQLGYLNVWTPRAELYHHESASRGAEDTPSKIARFNLETSAMKRRWGSVLRKDPAYNPNLSLDGSHFELAFPPRVAGDIIARSLAPRP